MTRKTQSRGQEGRHPQPSATPDSDIRIVHSSDIHVDTDYNAHLHGGDGTKGLASVLDTAHHLGADVVVLAGDVFENNRLPLDVLNRTADLLRDFDRPVVILPGNHDPAVPESAHHRGGFADLANVSILGITHAKAVRFAALDLEIWGRAHLDYDDMAPLAEARPRRTGWQIVVRILLRLYRPAFQEMEGFIHDRKCKACPWSCAAIVSMTYSPSNWRLLAAGSRL